MVPATQAIAISRFSALILPMFVLIFFIGVPGYILFNFNSRIEKEIEQINVRYSRQKSLQVSGPDFSKSLAETNVELQKRLYVTSIDLNKFSNEFQEAIKSMLLGTGVEVISTIILPVKTDGGVEEVTLDIRIEGTYEKIYNALESLSSHSPRLFVRSMSLQSAGAIKPKEPVRMSGNMKISVQRILQ